MEELRKLEPMLETIIGHYGYYMFALAMAFFFKDFINNAVKGFQFFLGKNFNELDIVYIEGRLARITKIGFSSTTFILYDRGTKMIVPNEDLAEMKLEKQLPMADMTRLPSKDDGDGGLYSGKDKPNAKKMSQDETDRGE